MKNTFKIIGILLLTFFSFYYTNKVVELSKSKDPIMIKILKESKDYTLESVNATIPATSRFNAVSATDKATESILVFSADLTALLNFSS